MGALFGFVVGYVVGARAGSPGYDQLAQAARDIRESEEFRAFLSILRSHVRETAATVSSRLATESGTDLAKETGSVVAASAAGAAAAALERARARLDPSGDQ